MFAIARTRNVFPTLSVRLTCASCVHASVAVLVGQRSRLGGMPCVMIAVSFLTGAPNDATPVPDDDGDEGRVLTSGEGSQ